MKAWLITIGNEILSGETLDTNSQYISIKLNEYGINVVKKITIPDEHDIIVKTILDGLSEADLLLSTGGLGPTKDDTTRRALADAFDCQLEVNKETFDRLEEIYKSRKLSFNKFNQGQALIPSKAKILINEAGTAPGLLLEKNGKILVAMPGIPKEMEYLMAHQILPYLKQHKKLYPIQHKNILTIGIRESDLAERIEGIENRLPQGLTLAYLPNLGTVKLRFSGLNISIGDFKMAMNEIEQKLRTKIGKYIFGEGNTTIAEVIGQLLRRHKCTLSTAESCTGGYLASMITTIPGSSDYFKGSVIAYANEVKMNELKVTQPTLDTFGAVSQQTVEQMAIGAVEKFKTDFAIATSGIAGPSGGTAEKPVGTVWIAVASANEVISRKFLFFKDREKNIHLSAITGLDMLRRMILGIS